MALLGGAKASMARILAYYNGVVNIRHIPGLGCGDLMVTSKASVLPLGNVDLTRNNSNDIGARGWRGFGVYLVVGLAYGVFYFRTCRSGTAGFSFLRFLR